jgi:uncharacterized damage-inducible protein DinB
MEPFFADIFGLLRQWRLILADIVDELPSTALDWSPAPEVNSPCVLVVHLCGAERYWIGEVVGGDPAGRDRDAEFRARGLDAAALKALLESTLAHAQGVLATLTLGDLEDSRVSPRDGREVTVGWALAHALEHTALHTGELQITRRWWQQQAAGN